MSSLRETWRQMHTIQFWVMVVAIIGWASLGVWLQKRIGWPERYGFHCHGRACWIDDMWHSPALIRGGHWGEYALFAWIWLLPVFVMCLIVWAARRKRKAARFSPPDRV